MTVPGDQTTRARIRDAGLALVAANGSKATSLREVGKLAGVSAALIVHHFGSKAGLISAIDDHAVGRIEAMLARVLERGGGSAGVQAFAREFAANRDLFRYFTRALQGNDDSGASTFDRLMKVTVASFAESDAAGLTRKVPDPMMRNIIMLCMDLGVLLLSSHVERHLGVELFTDDALFRWSAAEFDLLSNGVFTGAFADAGARAKDEE